MEGSQGRIYFVSIMKALLRSNELAGVLFVVSEDLNSSLNLGENLSLNRRTSFELQMIGD
jgi:hypothetical protein